MSETCIYDKMIDSKTGIKIPVFKSGRTVDSRYDPVRESFRITQQIKPSTRFVIILGIASGTLINSIKQNRKNIFIIGVEKSQKEIDFLLQLNIVKEINQSDGICLCTIEQLEQKIIQNYLPSFYGNLEIVEQPGWTLENKNILPEIKNIISKALSTVSSDFSVQSHFGKLWTHNILSNLLLLEKTNNKQAPHSFTIDISKTAVIFAAGPSLDRTIQTFLNQSSQKKYYLIATDTAFSTLLAYNLIPDVVVSIDGQYVSNTHFIHQTQNNLENILFLFDLCANSSAVKKLIKQNCNISFFKSGHPLCEYVDEYFDLKISSLFSGAGTVTITAVDFALKSGFKNIIVAGADFSYIDGKPYAKGTYLDKLYNSTSTRLQDNLQKFCTLEFRTELEAAGDNRFTTTVLQRYRQSFEEYLLNNKTSFEYKYELYFITNSGQQSFFNLISSKIKKEIFTSFIKTIVEQNSSNFSDITDLTKKDISLLPLISWIRTHDNNNEAEFIYYFNKAVNYFIKWS
ncbi:MAG: motility associated factor glycosyltransferase family protein [Treponema sp.]|nr:motility associated factor glycosyltransferase family protein [Treponema sp.]